LAVLFTSKLNLQAGRSASLTLALLPPLFSILAIHVAGQSAEPVNKPAHYAGLVRSKAAAAQHVNFDALIELLRKSGEAQPETVARFRVKVAVAPGRKYLLWVGDKNNPEYLIVSNGERTWAYSPARRKFVEVEAVPSSLAADPDRALSPGTKPQDADPILCSNLILPILRTLDHSSAAVVDLKTFSDEAGEEGPSDLRWLTVLSPQPESGEQKLTEVALDLSTFQLANLNWTKAWDDGAEKVFSSLHVKFDDFRLEEPAPASYFVFSADAANRVAELPIPGLFGTSLLGKRAPNVEMVTADSQRVRLSERHADPVLLTFTGPSCVPCEKQSAAVAAIRNQYKDGKVTILEARKENANIHALFGVNFLPTTILIDKDGVISRFLPGLQDESKLRALLMPAQESAAR
jgi:peroxiredoxin